MASVILGTDVETGEVVRIGDIERRSGLYLLGRTGMGKSALSVNCAISDLAHGYGVFFIDPAGDAVNDLLRRGDPHKLKHIAYLFNIRDDDYSFGINLLACPNIGSLSARNDAYARAYNVFFKIWEEQWGVWLQLILENVLWAFIENPGYSLADVPMFLNPRNEDFRNHIISNIRYNTPVADFWRSEFFIRRESSQQERVDAVLTRLNSLLNHPYVRDIVGQAKTTIDFANVLSTNKVILLKLSANLPDDVKKFVGTILLNELVHAVRDRPEDKRTQFCVFIDEFHNFASDDSMATLSTEGRKFGVASTYMHVERFGQLVNNQKLMGATAAIVNKGLFQPTVKDAEEFAPEFAKRVEPTEIRREPELVLSPSPVEDIWDRGHPKQDIMWLRGRYFWIVDLLRNQPNEKYFVFDPYWTMPEFRKFNPLEFRMQDFTDWDYYHSSADMIRQAISLWNQYLYDWMRGKYDPNEAITDEQVELTIKMIECLGGVLGFLPMLRPHIPNEKRARLIYLMNEKIKQDHEQNTRQKVQALKDEREHIRIHTVIPPSYEEEFKWTTPSNPHSQINYMQINMKNEIQKTRDEATKAGERSRGLLNQILQLEHSQPSQYTSLPYSIASCKDINEIKTFSIQAGMPTHEVEEFIEWELNPFTNAERTTLIKYLKNVGSVGNGILIGGDNGRSWHLQKDTANQLLNHTAKRTNVLDGSSLRANNRLHWQFNELLTFINSFRGIEPRILANDPIKIPSGKYVETLRVERTQQDLNNETTNELSNLPRFQAYVKLIDESEDRQIVRTHKIQTNPLPSIQDSGMIDQAIANGHTLGKKRDEIEAEIEERQKRWLPGSDKPTTRGR